MVVELFCSGAILLNIAEPVKAYRLFLPWHWGALFASARSAAVRSVCAAAVILFAVVLLISFSTQAHASWYFKKKKEEPYIARVGNVYIKLADFEAAIRKLHTSKRVGRALSEGNSFEKQSFAKYLDELIDKELMVMETERLGLDKEEEFQRLMRNFTLNIFLGELKREEITEKVNISETEIQAELDKQGISEGSPEKSAEPEKNAGPHDPSSRPRQLIIRNLTRAKSKAREAQFFKELKGRASINIKDKALNVFSSTDEKLNTRVVAVVEGEKIKAIDLLRELRGKSQHDKKLLRETLDNLILHKLLDKEAFSRGYGSLPVAKASIDKYRKKRLLDVFNRRVILPIVKIDEKEIRQYYDANPDKFTTPPSYKLRMIFVADEPEVTAIVSELNRGADFGFLARERSLDPTKDKMGNLGWVPATRLSGDIAAAAARAGDGDVIGPFKMEYGYSVMERLERKPGDLKPYASVREDIDRQLGSEKFLVIYKKYLKRLRETVPVKINEKALKKVMITRPEEG